mgnify:CR=1 FL=1|tara:strand:- start:135 stop:305 length:171 start_codon:yes stop_codon:yes gene_type:complete
MKLYIYDTATRQVVAIVEGETNAECEVDLLDWDTDTYAATYLPAFGTTDGLIEGES